MTDKQFSILRTIVVGTAFFIGGAILFPNSDFSVLFMIGGGVLLVKDYLIAIYRPGSQGGEKAKEKEEQDHDPN